MTFCSISRLPTSGAIETKGRLEAGDREKAAAAEERMLVGEAEHRVGAAPLGALEGHAARPDVERHRDGHLAVRVLDVDRRAREG